MDLSRTKEVLFGEVGKKLKKIALVIFFVFSVVSVISGIVCMCAIYDGVGFIVGIPVIVFGIFFAWLFSIGIYAFGELVDCVINIDKTISSGKNKKNQEQKVEKKQFVCTQCGTNVNEGDLECGKCGMKFDWTKI